MALKMTVNSKLEANSKQHRRYISDPERLKKDLENERRITRLQQVREKSKELARTIRQEVAAEQTRQLENLENIKQQEFNAWREHVVAKKFQDYRTSMFQVGAAHRAAQAETEKIELGKQLRLQKIKNCRLTAKRATKPTATNVLRATGGMGLNVEGRVSAGTQTPVQADKVNDCKENRSCNRPRCKSTRNHNSGKRKRQPCCQNNDNHQDESDNEEIIESLSDSSNSCDEPTAAQPTTSEASVRRLQKTPPIILDVDDESEDSLEICSIDGIEINDMHMQTNRKFSRVVRPSNTNGSELQEDPGVEGTSSRPRFTQISDLVRRTTRISELTAECAQGQQQEQEIHMRRSPTISLPRSPNKTTTTEAQVGSSQRSPIRAAMEQPTTSNHPRDNRRPAQRQKQSTLKPSSKRILPAKVIDAGLKRSLTTVQPKAATAQQTTTKLSQEPTAQKPRPQQPVVEAPRTQQMPQQEPPIEQLPIQPPTVQQLPMQPPPIRQLPMPTVQQLPMQPFPPYMPMQPHLIYGPQMMQPYPILPFPMQPYTMQPMRQFAPQPALPTQPTMPASSTATAATTGAPTRTTASHTTVSTTTYMLRQGQPGNAASGHVQFYDHNNKYQRQYKAPTEAVQANLPDNTDMNAMEQANAETLRRQLREQELQNLRQVTEQRGQKALQREQVRRDCAQLTEKLDALTQQQPQLLPSDANFVPSHRFADLASRREQKMNAAIEQILLRPAIVTCPEVGVSRHLSPRKTGTRCKSITPEAINLGNPPMEKADDAASCCSMLIDYVDDQSKQLRTELKGMQSNSVKSVKLRSLLQRIEKIKEQLLAELQAGDMNGDNAQKVIDSIRKERANIHTGSALNIDQREMELQQKEELLEQRLRQLYKHQQKVDGRKHNDNPVEIIIKVKSDGTVKQYVPKTKMQDNQKSKTTMEQGNSKPSTSSSAEAVGSTTSALNQRQNSIDSTSTVYRELPPVNYKNIRPPSETPASTSTSTPAQPEPLHPIIAQYVQRLLGMSRNSIDKLSVSSSEVTTPADSIINQPRNISTGPAVDETLLDNQRMERVQAFIQDNRSFVDELEDTMRSQQLEQQQQQEQQQQLDKEASLRAFDQIWNKRLATKQQQQQKEQQQAEAVRPKTSDRATATRRATSTTFAQSTSRSVAYRLPQQGKMPPTRVIDTQRQQRHVEPSSTNQTNKSPMASEQSAALHMERYERLTENCTQRIAELTELITKVREEKQRLVEVTLTSASEGERHSTEYFDLPPGQREQEQQLQQPGSRTISERSDSHDTTPSHSEALPLQKHKPTGASLDSGISISRPLTAMGQEPPEAEPTSLTSSTQSGAQRRGKVPPATIRRYSPQLAAEDLAHELSTITEVDTPAQSHMLVTTPAPVPFPSFEQYAQELQLDLSHIDPNQSMRLQQEFQEIIHTIQQRGHGIDYREFPSISAYLHNITTTTTRVHIEAEHPSLAATDLLQQMRMPNVSIHEFPNRREYLQQLLARQPPEQGELIDSGSLDSSDSFNVEAELRQRRLLLTSFRRGPEADELPELEVASSTRRESIPPGSTSQAPNESGIEPPYRCPLTFDVQLDMQRMGVRRPVSMRHRQRGQADHPNSSADSESPKDRSTGGCGLNKSSDAPEQVSQLGRSLNLREFLTKELLKHRVHNEESSSGSTDDSLKSNFLQSVIGSLSLSRSSCTPALGHATNGTNDRQKTSTPVGSLLSDQGKAGSLQSDDTQLFSGESRLSAVNYADGTPPVPHEQQASLGRNSKTPKATNRKTLRK
ncbi:uncharacterized protein LOC6563333 [Drosophila grimshawi]|uniref:uncharacterized protein LOC6563333 n=1 Tax=Drosophila grimshawi TaxID=7222 RepID=UPI001C931EF0|nr:uncharacterized protein LOC6563333 [Drosophila grimshawi]